MGRLWPWLRLLAAVGILVALGWRLGTGAFLDGLRAINIWSVLTALGIGLVTTVFSAWRWCVVARRLGLPLTLGSAVSDYYQGLLLNAVLPAGVLGDVHRAVNHGRQSGDVGRGVRAVVLERSAGQIVLIATGILVLLTQPALAAALIPSRAMLITALAALLAAAAVATRIPAVRRALMTAWADARIALLSRATGSRVALASAATVAGHVALFVVAARVAGVSAPLAQLVPLLVLALLVMALPLNVGGFGPREAFLAVAFAASNLNPAQGLTTAIVYGVLAMIASLPGILALFRSRPGESRQALALRSEPNRATDRPRLAPVLTTC